LLLAASTLVVAACQSADTVPTESQQALATGSASHLHPGSDAKPTSDQLKVIARVREATVRFHDVEAAVLAGYDLQFPAGCAASPDGAQGYHFLNRRLAADAVTDPLTPELLMYEPGPNGRLELVGVDYIIPYDQLPASTRPKPMLPGVKVEMMNNDPLEVWALHIWSRRPNPRGMFAAWNPSVSCQNQNVARLPQLQD